ncbi:hypothetical protein MMC26_003313 [Xylographa opegraphella]|nr:hypothetical protein [Xylographa opegraphella]
MDDVRLPHGLATRSSHDKPGVDTQPFLFLHLPEQLRLLVIEQLLWFPKPVSVFRPDMLLDWSLSPFPDELVALRMTSRQMKDEADHVFMSCNHFLVHSLSDLTFICSKANEFFCCSIRHLILGRHAFVVTQLEETLGYIHQSFHTTKVLASLGKFSFLQTLKITLPWEENGLSNPEFEDLIDFFVLNIRTKKLIITRPDIEFLIPGNTGHTEEFSVSRGSEFTFFAEILRAHPQGYQYPINTLAILSNDVTHIRRINNSSQILGKELCLLPSRVMLRLSNWLNGGTHLCNEIVWESDLDLD